MLPASSINRLENCCFIASGVMEHIFSSGKPMICFFFCAIELLLLLENSEENTGHSQKNNN